MQQYNQRIADWLGAYRDAIQSGNVRVFAVDECHLKGGDICGYGWGNRQERREVEVANYRDSQTYFGAVDCISGELLISAAETANGDSTIEFIERLRAVSQGARIVIVWDGASYHRSQQLRDFLAHLNQGEDWQIHCLRFPPYAPQENPIENLWGQAKHRLRQMHQKCRSFTLTRRLFELLFKYQLLTLPDIKTYSAFSSIT